MKLKKNPYLASCLLAVALACSASAADLTWNNGSSTGNWNTTDANWSGASWTAGDNAFFNTTTGTINITQAISGGSLTFGTSGGSGVNNTGSFAGSALTLSGNLTAIANGNNGPGGPTLSFSNNVSVAGDVSIGRRVLEVTSGTFTANRILSADSWGRLLISGGTVTATNGIDDSINGGNTLSVVLSGGSLYTPYIRTTSAGFTGLPSDGVVLSGGTLYATANSNDFIQTYDPGWGNRNNIGVGTGGANINTNGFDITITKQMQDYGGAGFLTKSGSGTLKFAAYQAYTGGTTINTGTLEASGQSDGWGWLRGAVTVNAGATLLFTGGDGTGFGWDNSATSLTINGGSFDAAGGSHVGFGNYMTVALNNGGTIKGNGQWNGDGRLGFSSSGDTTNTFNGSWVLRGDNGANHTFNVADGAAAVDLQANANFSEINGPCALVKSGSGTMVLAGNNSYGGQTDITAGMLVAASSAALGVGGHNGATMSWIRDGATLGLQGGISLDEHFHVWGTGVGGLGAIRSISGNNALTNAPSGGPGYALRSNTTIGVDADTLSVSGFYNGDGGSYGITKTGQGSLTLSGNNTYTGSTNVTGGTLVVNGTISSSSLTTVASGATLGGSGTVGALTISTGGSINPGNSPGILNVNGAYNQAGTLIAEITGTTPGTGHDQINVTGSVNLSGALTLDVTNAGTGYVLNSMIFLILNDGVDAVTGAFSNYAQGANVGNFGGFDWIITYQANSTTSSFTGGNDVALRAIPEASTALLGGLGALGLLRRRRNA